VQLCYALTDVFEETRARVLAWEHEVRLQRGHAPNLRIKYFIGAKITFQNKKNSNKFLK